MNAKEARKKTNLAALTREQVNFNLLTLAIEKKIENRANSGYNHCEYVASKSEMEFVRVAHIIKYFTDLGYKISHWNNIEYVNTTRWIEKLSVPKFNGMKFSISW